MKIEVTAEDIKKGRSGEEDGFSSNCPIARAAKRAWPGWGISVSGNRLRLHVGKRKNSYVVCRYDLPPEAVSFVDEFDNNGKRAVKPFTFELP